MVDVPVPVARVTAHPVPASDSSARPRTWRLDRPPVAPPFWHFVVLSLVPLGRLGLLGAGMLLLHRPTP